MPKRRDAEPIPTNEEIAAKAKEEKKLDARVKKLQGDLADVKTWIVRAMERAGTRLVEVNGVRVVYTKQEPVEYDEAGLHASMTPKERRLAFDEMLDITALPAAERKALAKKLEELLTKSQRRRATKFVLNKKRMSQAVQEGKIRTEVVTRHASIAPREPYTTITLKGKS